MNNFNDILDKGFHPDSINRKIPGEQNDRDGTVDRGDQVNVCDVAIVLKPNSQVVAFFGNDATVKRKTIGELITFALQDEKCQKYIQSRFLKHVEPENVEFIH